MTKLMIVLAAILAVANAQGGCPESKGIQTYPDDQYCDKFYKCEDGVLSEETCENGLVYDHEGHGNVHNFCDYNWKVDCGERIYDDTPISSPGCLYQYGIYPVGEGCQTTFFKCAAGQAYETACTRGQAYQVIKHGCDYPDQVEECKGQEESVVGFKCPSNDQLPPNAIARRFLPYPRFPVPDDKTAYIVCVYGLPRLQFCGYNSIFDEQTLSCLYYEDEHLEQRPQHLGQGF